MKKVFKYGTGQEIPEGATYLKTEVETRQYSIEECLVNGAGEQVMTPVTYTDNQFVWHYFLVEVTE